MTQPLFATTRPMLIPGLRQLLSAAGITGDLQIVNTPELERTLTPGSSRLVILDAKVLPAQEKLAMFCAASPQSYFVLWASNPTAELVQTAVVCGLHGILSTRLPLEEASQVLARICQGERVFRFDLKPGPLASSTSQKLTAREQQAIYLLGQGASNAEIALALGTTVGTVKVCMSRMFRKTGAQGREQLLMLSNSAALPTQEPRRALAAAATFDAQWMLRGEDPERGDI